MTYFFILTYIPGIGYFQNTREDIRDELIVNFIENRLSIETQHGFVVQNAQLFISVNGLFELLVYKCLHVSDNQ